MSSNASRNPYSTPPDFYSLRHYEDKLERHRKAVQQDLAELERFVATHPHTAQWLQERGGKKRRPTLVVDNTNSSENVVGGKRQVIKRYRPKVTPDDAA